MTARLDYLTRYLALTPLGYEFGDPVKAEVGLGDAKWLNVRVAATDGSISWERIEPCFSDGELHDLVRWLRALGVGDSGEVGFLGIEPMLSFKGKWGVGRIRLDALFNLELHPDGGHAYRDDPKVVSFEVSRSALGHFADALEAELSRFPEPRDRGRNRN